MQEHLNDILFKLYVYISRQFSTGLIFIFRALHLTLLSLNRTARNAPRPTLHQSCFHNSKFLRIGKFWGAQSRDFQLWTHFENLVGPQNSIFFSLRSYKSAKFHHLNMALNFRIWLMAFYYYDSETFYNRDSVKFPMKFILKTYAKWFNETFQKTYTNERRKF